MKHPFPEEDAAELRALKKAFVSPEKALAKFTPVERSWIDLWYYVSDQRHGVGMAVGGLIHSEVEGDLRRKGYQDRELDRTMDRILLVDRLYQEFMDKRTDSGSKGRVGRPDGTEAARTMIAERQKVLARQPQEGERKSRAV